MAQFFVTNSKELYTRLNERVLQTEFEKSFDYTKEGLYAMAWQSLCNTEKQVYTQGDAWCIISGLCISNSSCSPKSAYEVFVKEVVTGRQKCLGQYGLALHKNDVTTIVCDGSCCHDLFYYNQNGTFLVSDSLYDMAYVLKDKISIDENRIIQKAVYHSFWNGETLCEGISRVLCDQIIEIRDNKLQVVKTEYEARKQVDALLPEEKVLPVIASKLQENAHSFYQAVGTPTIFITGGVDSRLILASFLSVGVKPNLLYLRGLNWCDAEDEEVARMYAKRYQLNLQIADARDFITSPDEYKKQITNHGFTTAYSWGGNAKVLRHLQETNRCLIFGWGGERFRHWENINSLDEFIKNHYSFPNRESIDKSKQVVRLNFINSFRKEIEYWNLSSKDLNYERWYYMMIIGWGNRDMHLPSLMQQLGYTYCPLNESSISQDLVSIQKGGGDGYGFQLRCIHAIFPDILSIPIFSCRKWWYVDKETMSMTLKNPALKKYKKNSLIGYLWDKAPRGIKERILKPLRDRLFKKELSKPESKEDSLKMVKDTVKELIPNNVDELFPVKEANGWEDISTFILLTYAAESLKDAKK